MISLNDPLANFIRPSGLKKLDLCPASAQMEAAVVEQHGEPPDGGAAALGTLAHAELAYQINAKYGKLAPGDCPRALDTWTRSVVDYAFNFANALIEKHQIEPENVLVEHHLDGDGFGLPNGGTADLILVVPFKRVIVVDFKAGFLAQDDADEHDQLACYSILAARTFKTQEILVYIVQPRADVEVTGATFDANALRITETWVRDVTRRARDPDAALNPGFEQCKFCKALPHCPAAKDYVMRLKDVLSSPIGPISDDDFGRLADAAKLAEKFADAGLTLVRTRITSGGKASGWEIGPAGTKKVIEDAEACFNVCSTSSEHTAQFWKAVKVSRTELDRQFGSQRDRYRALLVEQATSGSLRRAK